ncbi:SUKH-4 family immunity protein [Paenibacillus macerans]|uniref:SUKH-4 family immunity protein n=1 Tax=Paenibacillus macerans TaxID=44252 RepID=UPI002E1D9326|nr:SUKH-4 family immunity protein [Paenibacillus macerans]
MLVSNQVIREFWEENLIKYEENSLQKFGLSNETISFLTDVGLPNEEILRNNGINRYFYDSTNFDEKIINNEKYIIVGKQKDISDYYCIKCETDEFVVLDENTVEYINSSIRNYIIFEQICRSEFYKVKAYEEEEMMAAVSRMKEKFVLIEPEALAEGSYWDQYLFPYEIGFL